eukprot:TRINITY_DN26415_c0_g1_i5.p1 TRINITY_DN26415_c0_g1~~TRINITY_DN26415_c0_g1_i5.p1  ORF type:complete len:575 (+),score=135.15 TRINITY_DN26415_c0_g1_i5:232-1956(+)
MLMIMNNLDRRVAQYPHELVTYGGNGSVFSNWAQYHLVMFYLSEMGTDQTLALYSGHPMGLFPSHADAPRLVITNGMMIPNYSTRDMYERLFALGCTQYGQMTAGSFCYIGPQGIVHGTTLTIKNAARKYLGKESMEGVVYVSAGLGGMSGAQPKASTICGAIGVIAEIDPAALYKRHEQGWVNEVATSCEECITMIREARTNKRAVSIGFLGNVITLWEALADLAEEGEVLVDLGSDQTSLHNPHHGGYYPVELSFDESREMMHHDPDQFKQLVSSSLQRHATAIGRLCNKGMRFWDYGNSFLLEAGRAGADVWVNPENQNQGFKYPTYVQDIMGDIFSLGFGPFRWVCASNQEQDLVLTDEIAQEELQKCVGSSSNEVIQQLKDNILWISKAHENEMVVGSQSRILYAHCDARRNIALEFNKAIKQGRLKGPVVLSRDHHDVSGTDSPFRETSNITDGSMFTADMAVQNCIGDACRGATWVALHNGGGCGWGEVMNGGFGLVLDGTDDAARRAAGMLGWDVQNGVCRRSWSGNANAVAQIQAEMDSNPRLKVTLPNNADQGLVETAFKSVQG